jgi:hypothetical protein
MNDQAIVDSRFDGEAAWSANAPKGAKAVLRRMLSETASTVPLFFGQTFVRSLRDVGYNDSVSAVCEHVDNAVQWGAKSVRVYFRQRGRRGDTKIDVLVLDDGVGMSPETLRVAMSFGGSSVYDRRDGIGRFGVGMKTAALSMGPRLEVFSWQEKAGFYRMELDVEDVGENQKNLVELPEPEFRERLPIDVVDIITEPQDFPRDPTDQHLLTNSVDSLNDYLGEHGTIIYIPDCDRVTYKQSKSLYEHAAREMSRVYRRMIAEGLKLYVNNKLIEPFDPTYWMKESRHTKIPELAETETRSQIVQTWQVEIPVEEGSKVTATASVRLYILPKSWHTLAGKVQKSSLRIFDDHQVSFMRNGREVSIGPCAGLNLKRHATTHWLSLQIDFSGDLDEAFGVAMTKQGVRPKGYALAEIDKVIAEQVTRTRKQIAEIQSQNRRSKTRTAQSEAERRAQEADPLQRKPLPETPEELAALEQNLRGLAISLKRNEETDEEAFERVKNSTYITVLKHDDFWPFYAVDYQYGKVILTVNTAHPFYNKLYKPLEELSLGEVDGDESEGAAVVPRDGELLVALQMMLFSLGRTQSQMTYGEGRDEFRHLFQALQTEWSDNLRTQLTVE